ncbi:ABC transporter ATP-binding protein [Chelatococcus composti]|uniref:Iron(III) transport system ATP-binding protein n=1 Tax=Chelatococcus composti TaxID=1743235 RepID=A0A841KDW6_9HYPH|nr:ABC transporter ATP-binding protein [Chelatococcus composti]MBB6169552.1 iron(III) transport system ATP-binding protein [Chelatococcus composti]MBS7736137.1 ABC transporter ATP-binding protein [Chelatococcus composti]GGG48650.1 spermidine/putrescine ABC transporter ATP-binding protein [Chelatococcus composti]
MARLTIDRVSKTFGNYRALDAVSMEVRDGEFLAVLGPSGCGKTTLLRQIAGFDQIDDGEIRIGDTVVSDARRHVPPEHRRVGIVFQSYALWPHMSVFDNVAYGLKVAGVKDPERTRRVKEALALVGLEAFAERRPGLLSGGQRQRVALARCLVTEPSLVLLDEPLANLDVHLRAAMEDEFARFHERTATTMIYITHDQAEAMALADRIAVMDRGRLLQIATPSDLFRQPANETVARFIGEGMVLPAEVGAADSEGRCHGRIYGLEVSLRASPLQKAGHAKVCLRARDLAIAGPGQTGLSAHIVRTVYQGGFFRLEASLVRAPDVTVHLAVPEPFHHGPGDVVDIVVNDGWVLPATTES